MNKQQVAKRLHAVRRELDECAEQVERLATEVDAAVTNKTPIVGSTEVAEMIGTGTAQVATMAARGKMPEPVAHLACGRIWLRSDIERWNKGRA